MNKKPTEIQGLFVPSNKTFYYLETGPITMNSSLERISKVLIARDITTAGIEPPDPTMPKTVIMTLAEASEKNYKIEVLYANSHIKANSTPTASTHKKIGWK